MCQAASDAASISCDDILTPEMCSPGADVPSIPTIWVGETVWFAAVSDRESGRLHGLQDAGDGPAEQWVVELARPIDGVMIHPDHPAGAAVLLATREHGQPHVEILALETGEPICTATLDRQQVAPKGWGGSNPRFAVADVNPSQGEEILVATMNFNSWGTQLGVPALYYAISPGCDTVATLTSTFSPRWIDVLDDIDFADYTGDGILDVIALYGGANYPYGQPIIEVVDFVEGQTSIVVSDNFGGGMTRLATGDFDGNPGVDFLTGGWWGPNVAAYNHDGNRLWSGAVDGGCGGADRTVMIDEVEDEPILLVGSGSYSTCNRPALSRVDPTTGATIWRAQTNDAGRNMAALVVAELDASNGGREVLAYGTSEASCAGNLGNWAIYTLSLASGETLQRTCSLFLLHAQATTLPATSSGAEPLWAVIAGTGENCPQGRTCLVNLDSDLNASIAVDLGELRGYTMMLAAIVVEGVEVPALLP